MGEGAKIFSEICHSGDPARAIEELNAIELMAVYHYSENLPEAGIPGVVRAQIVTEQARRYRDKKGGEA
jgi:hypothetical protein